MNYVSTNSYDEQTVRWFTPDPAEQFSNPYLAMGNNPVSYVDPDGEFVFVVVGAVVGAYLGGTLANDHGNPLKWDYQSADTWIGMGVGGVIGAFGGQGLAAAKGKSAFFGMAKGSKIAAAAGKKFFGSTVGGITNTIANYDGEDSFGWGTLADFGAGYAGSYAGINFESKFMGFTVGGTVNTISQGMQAAVNGDDFTGYNMAQSFIGGGLSSMVGMSYGMPKPAAPIGQKATLQSFGKSFVKYSGQSAMWDFAYTKQEDFAKRNFGDFATLYGVGGALGASVDMLKFMKPSTGVDLPLTAQKYFKSGMNAAAFIVELRMTSQLKGKPGKPKYQPTKGGVLGAKWIFNLGSYY